MNENIAPLPHRTHPIRWLVGAILVLIVIAIFIGGYGGLQKLFGMLPGEQASAIPSDLHGTLILSVGMTSTTTGQSLGFVPSLIQANTGSVEYLPADSLGGSQAITLQYALSPDSSTAVFMGTQVVGSGATAHMAQATPSIYSADISAATDTASLASALTAAPSVSDPTSTDYFREFPVTSSDNSILYMSLPESAYLKSSTTLSSLNADAWNIDMLDSSGTKTTVATGIYPKWIDATHFAFLKDDGIYLHDLASGSDTKVWSTSHVANIVMGFDVSDDGQFAALTDPSMGQVQVFHALNWPGGIVSNLATLSITATNPVIAPDDTYLAMVALQQNSSDPQGALIPTLEYYSLTTQKFIPQKLRFDPTSTSAIYLTDWR